MLVRAPLERDVAEILVHLHDPGIQLHDLRVAPLRRVQVAIPLREQAHHQQQRWRFRVRGHPLAHQRSRRLRLAAECRRECRVVVPPRRGYGVGAETPA